MTLTELLSGFKRSLTACDSLEERIYNLEYQFEQLISTLIKQSPNTETLQVMKDTDERRNLKTWNSVDEILKNLED